VRARSVSLLLMHYAAGTHGEVTRWHEEVHRREMHASVAHMYHSQDWVAPPAFVQARPGTALAERGGEYATLYFADSPADQLNADIRRYADQTRGNYHPRQEVMWRGRMDITHAQARDDWQLTMDTVPLFRNVGLLVHIGELTEPDSPQYDAWSQQIYIPTLLRSNQLSGVFQMKPTGPEGGGVRVHLGFVEHGDALAAFEVLKECHARAGAAPCRDVFFGMYVPIGLENYDTYQ
jgi:hypothetical protein